MSRSILFAMAFVGLSSLASAATVIPQSEAPDNLIVGTEADLRANGYTDGCADPGAEHPCVIPIDPNGAALRRSQACTTQDCLDQRAYRDFLESAAGAMDRLGRELERLH